MRRTRWATPKNLTARIRDAPVWKKWLYRLQETLGMSEKECRAFLLLALLLLLGAVARCIPKSRMLFDEAYYAELDTEFERLAAQADSADQAWHTLTHPESEEVPPQGPINLNEATSEMLQLLPRIGPALAERILSLREELGGFLSVSDLLMVQGIGERTLEGIRDSVYVEPPATRDDGAVDPF